MKSFVKKETVETPAEMLTSEQTAPTSSVKEETKTVAKPPTGAVQVRPQHSGFFDGEVSTNDIKKPFLTVVHPVGKKCKVHTPGTVLVGESVVCPPPTKPSEPTGKVRIMFAKVSKIYKQNLKYDPAPGAPRPLIVKTEAEVVAAGGTIHWKTIDGKRIPPSWIQCLNGVILVRAPETLKDDGQFSIIGGTNTYACALVSFQKTSYPAAQTVLTDLSFSLEWDGTRTFYDLFWAMEDKGLNSVYVAKLIRVRDEKPSDELRAIASKLAGSATEVIEEDETAAV